MTVALLLSLGLALASPAPTATLTTPDRTTPPAVLPATPRALPEPRWTQLTPSARLAVVQVPRARKVEIALTLERGVLALGGDRTAAEAAGWLMDVATTEASAAEFEILKDLEDVQIASNLDATALTLTATAPLDSLDLALRWLGEVLRSPAYPAADLARWKLETAYWYETQAATSPESVGQSALQYAWWPADHPHGARPDLRAITKVRRGALTQHHQRLLEISPIHLLVTGDVDPAAITPALTELVAGLGTPGPRAPGLTAAPPKGLTVLAVDLPGQTQVGVQLRLAAPTSEHADHLPFAAVDHALGGTFVSRLNRNLREQHGYTYGAGSGYSVDRWNGHWTVRVDVRSEVLEDTVRQITLELGTMREAGCTRTELDALYRERVSGWNDTMKTASSALSLYDALYQADRTLTEAHERLDRLRALTPEATQRAAETWLSPDAGQVWVFVGARAAIEAPLQALGLQPTWIDANDAVLGTFDVKIER